MRKGIGGVWEGERRRDEDEWNGMGLARVFLKYL